MKLLDPLPCATYWCYDGTQLLYVGQAREPHLRIRQHRSRGMVWVERVTHVETLWFRLLCRARARGRCRGPGDMARIRHGACVMTAPGGSLGAEFLDPAFATTACEECGVQVAHVAMAEHLIERHGHEPA
jgi:hypothetical protein